VRDRLRAPDAPRRSVARTNVVGQPSHGGVWDRRDRRRAAGGQHVGASSEGWPLARATTGGLSPCPRR
jgi:hypothetical protein